MRARLSSWLALWVTIIPLATAQGAIAADPKYRYDGDCNYNGILDGRDSLLGTIEDLNANGSEDLCDGDAELMAFLEGGWKRLAQRYDSSYVGLSYFPSKMIVIRYTVPRGRHEVAIIATDSIAGTSQILRSARQQQGAYELQWKPTGKDGKLLSDGQYHLHITIASKKYAKRAAWHWVGQPR